MKWPHHSTVQEAETGGHQISDEVPLSPQGHLSLGEPWIRTVEVHMK